MDNSSSQTRNQSQAPQQQSTQSQLSTSGPKNVKNLSIKDFFTTRLMRTRSYEGAAGSPKDEASNWFDEFKARMMKKSQAKQAVPSNTSNNSAQENADDSAEVGETVVRFAAQPKIRRRRNNNNIDDSNTPLVKDSCDTELNTSEETSKEVGAAHINTFQSPATSNLSSKPSSHGTIDGLRKVPKISCVESLDFETSSINTIFNRRDSRYEKILRTKGRLVFFRKISNFIPQLVAYLLPFNYNLPWKLLAFVNSAFTLIITAIVYGGVLGIENFNFFYGFLSGLIVTTCCFLVIGLSLLVHILPKSEHQTQDTEEKSLNSSNTSTMRSNICGVDGTTSFQNTTLDTSYPKSDDFSLFEVLEDDTTEPNIESSRIENVLDDDDYKGWMIEFLGDYELRNKSDFKLKLIFVKLENRTLILCKPKNNDAESATFPVFVHRRVFDLNSTKKFTVNLLLPRNVRNRQKWVWSKKYPIKIEIQDFASEATSSEPAKTIQLTLFAKSCREKEEWFRRFKKIVDEIRLAQGQLANKRASLQSEQSGSNEGSESNRGLKFRTPSPTASESIQTSRSSHIINDLLKCTDDVECKPESFGSNLVRTKSCELFQTIQGESSTDSDLAENGLSKFMPEDDSTLTRETADLFSHAVEYSNFLESRPNLSYFEYIEKVIESGKEATPTSDWFNALTGRIFFDVFSHSHWSVWFKRKIQRKLRRIRLPYFMETLTLTKIDLGTEAPHFLNVVSHSFDSFGLSIDFDMAYNGGLTMTFETKLNLLKIKSDNANQTLNAASSSGVSQAPSPNQVIDSSDVDLHPDQKADNSPKETFKPSSSSSGSARTSGESSDSEDSDSDSSSASSSDDADEISDWEDYGAEKTRQSIVRFVDKIASSRYFQHATENRYIKKKLIDISNCPLILTVQIQSLNGILTLNVPPPQTDRVWYGFKPNPELTLKALPKMGDREVNLSHVTDWIEKKLAEEFRKILVIPNMEDFVLPILKSDHLLYVTSTK